MTRLISQTENGKIFKCSSCNQIHIEYKNLNFNFNKKEYDNFRDYFKELDGQYWEEHNTKSPYRRKIIVPIGHKNVNILLNNTELQELRSMFFNHQYGNMEIIEHFKFNISTN